MNISSNGSSGSGSPGNSQDFELNLASIIDCLTVLITFLLASTAFLSIGILDAGVAAGGANASDSSPPPVNVTVELGRANGLEFKVAGKSKEGSGSVAAKDGHWDLDALTARLQAIHRRWPQVNAITLTADGSVEYRDVVQVMDTARKTMPAVMLGGF